MKYQNPFKRAAGRPHSDWAYGPSRKSKVDMEPKISAYRSVEPIFRALVLVPVRQHTR